jgi:hypothetical protein
VAYHYKFGTEYEGNTHDEVRAACALLGAENVTLKIGGPDARNDLALAAELGLARVIAPMVESCYAVRVFDEACRAVGYEGTRGIMVETVHAWAQLAAILDAAAAALVDHVTIGRSDLAESFGQRVEQMDPMVGMAWEMASVAGLDVSVGGKITPGEAVELRGLGVTSMNTRHVYFSCPDDDTTFARAATIAALNEEARVLCELAMELPARGAVLVEMARQAQKRRQDLVRKADVRTAGPVWKSELTRIAVEGHGELRRGLHLVGPEIKLGGAV